MQKPKVSFVLGEPHDFGPLTRALAEIVQRHWPDGRREDADRVIVLQLEGNRPCRCCSDRGRRARRWHAGAVSSDLLGGGLMLARVVENNQLKIIKDIDGIRDRDRAGQPIWIELEEQCAEADELLVKTLNIHPLTIEDIWGTRSAAQARGLPQVPLHDHPRRCSGRSGAGSISSSSTS